MLHTEPLPMVRDETGRFPATRNNLVKALFDCGFSCACLAEAHFWSGVYVNWLHDGDDGESDYWSPLTETGVFRIARILEDQGFEPIPAELLLASIDYVAHCAADTTMCLREGEAAVARMNEKSLRRAITKAAESTDKPYAADELAWRDAQLGAFPQGAHRNGRRAQINAHLEDVHPASWSGKP